MTANKRHYTDTSMCGCGCAFVRMFKRFYTIKSAIVLLIVRRWLAIVTRRWKLFDGWKTNARAGDDEWCATHCNFAIQMQIQIQMQIKRFKIENCMRQLLCVIFSPYLRFFRPLKDVRIANELSKEKEANKKKKQQLPDELCGEGNGRAHWKTPLRICHVHFVCMYVYVYVCVLLFEFECTGSVRNVGAIFFLLGFASLIMTFWKCNSAIVCKFVSLNGNYNDGEIAWIPFSTFSCTSIKSKLCNHFGQKWKTENASLHYLLSWCGCWSQLTLVWRPVLIPLWRTSHLLRCTNYFVSLMNDAILSIVAVATSAGESKKLCPRYLCLVMLRAGPWQR